MRIRKIANSPAARDGRVPDRDAIIDGLARVRQRTLDIVSPLSDAGIRMQHSPIMSPVIWDLGHIAEFEDLWLVQRLEEVSSESALADAYDAMRTPRSARGDLDLPDRGATLDRLFRVRERAVARLRELDLAGSGNRLLEDGFVYGLVREHEAQHQETVLQTIFLMETDPYAPVRRECPPDSESVSAGQAVEVQIPEVEVINVVPQTIALDLIYEDEQIIVINKPAGLVVHPGAGNARGTLLNGLLAYHTPLERLPRGGIVHRLDKQTSGLMVFDTPMR